ncbi:MAG: hypothetical protein HON98_04335 [Chloroflexi bacterium]|jgi:hypothetical protein|nr:hypothetical protein [Chloroflexota bacterium]MBT3671234.1 hypothetical protein [Chloroflexota bacterium]MBT4003554.1 hypothetical protein [Chloroflexota bacterium]MBT4304307.1 hypothetical protein [Chloroflexota bacterium]MBT4534326.1 hypothetical protein [Chloroflexota bacterium]
MSRAGKSVYYFGYYVFGMGLLLLFISNLLLPIVNVPTTDEVWIRLVGMLLLVLGLFYRVVGKNNFLPGIHLTLVTRSLAFFVILGFIYFGFISWVIFLFWLGDLAGVIWTWRALKADQNDLVEE